MANNTNFINEARRQGYDDAEIASFLEAQKAASKEERFGKYLSAIPIAGAVLGGAGAGLTTAGLGAGTGAAVGYGAGYATEDALRSLLGMKREEPREALAGAGRGMLAAGAIGTGVGGLAQFLAPGKTLGRYAGRLGELSEKTISGSELAEAQKRYAASQRVSTGGLGTAQRLAGVGQQRWGGRQLSIPEAMQAKTAAWQSGYTTRGAPKDIAAAGFERATGEQLKRMIAEQEPGIGRIAQLQSIIHSIKGTAGAVARRPFQIMGLSRLLGL